MSYTFPYIPKFRIRITPIIIHPIYNYYNYYNNYILNLSPSLTIIGDLREREREVSAILLHVYYYSRRFAIIIISTHERCTYVKEAGATQDSRELANKLAA